MHSSPAIKPSETERLWVKVLKARGKVCQWQVFLFFPFFTFVPNNIDITLPRNIKQGTWGGVKINSWIVTFAEAFEWCYSKKQR